VHPDPGQAGLGGEFVELAQDELVAQGLTVAAGEDQVLLVPGGPGAEPLGVLAFALSLQGAYYPFGQPDPGSAAAGFGGAEHRGGVVDVGQGVAHEQQP
jgi:hypothetical protein